MGTTPSFPQFAVLKFSCWLVVATVSIFVDYIGQNFMKISGIVSKMIESPSNWS